VSDWHLYRAKRRWCPEWLWRLVRPLVLWEPLLSLFTEPPAEEDWGK
jgi:hypothetical protein